MYVAIKILTFNFQSKDFFSRKLDIQKITSELVTIFFMYLMHILNTVIGKGVMLYATCYIKINVFPWAYENYLVWIHAWCENIFACMVQLKFLNLFFSQKIFFFRKLVTESITSELTAIYIHIYIYWMHIVKCCY